MEEATLCNSTPPLCDHLNASCFFCLFECRGCWVTSVGFQQACHSDCLSWGRDLCESCFSSSLLRLSADGDPHPRWPTHQNKRDRGSWFSDKHHSLSLLSEGRGGAQQFISRGSPPSTTTTRYRLPPARRPITQELLKANVSQGEGGAFLPEVSHWGPLNHRWR